MYGSDSACADPAYIKSGAILGGAGANSLEMPELGKLKAAAGRVGVATNRLEGFAGRFFGPSPEIVSNAPAIPQGYRNDLESLFEQIERLETVLSAIDHIG